MSDSSDASYSDEDLSIVEVAASKNKRKRRAPNSLRLYDTTRNDETDIPTEKKAKKGWCIIEWDGENTYDPIPCKDVSSLDGMGLSYNQGESCLAYSQGARYRGKIAAVADTKACAEKEYVKNAKRDVSSPSRKELRKEKVLDGKKSLEKKKKSANPTVQQQQMDRETKFSETSEFLDTPANYTLSLTKKRYQSENSNNTPSPTESTTKDEKQKCCKMCQVNKQTVERIKQDMALLHKAVSRIQSEVSKLKSAHSNSSVQRTVCIEDSTEVITPVPLSPVSPQSTPSQIPAQSLSQLSSPSQPSLLPQSPLPPPPPLPSFPQSPSTSVASAQPSTASQEAVETGHWTLSDIPHHLKSRASSAGNYKKAARLLSAAMFTLEERRVSTLSGGKGKKMLDRGRMTLIHDFLHRVFPKTFDGFQVNRVIGQVTIETRSGRHQCDDTIVKGLLQQY